MSTEYTDYCTERAPNDPYVFEVWRNSDHIAGTQRQDIPPENWVRYAVLFRFYTSYGWFVILSDDKIITRQHAINFARAFAKGNVIRWRVDLKDIQP